MLFRDFLADPLIAYSVSSNLLQSKDDIKIFYDNILLMAPESKSKFIKHDCRLFLNLALTYIRLQKLFTVRWKI